MRILALADIDELHWEYGLGKADVLLSCGDVYDQVILEASRSYNCHAVFAVKGNHDHNEVFKNPVIDLHRNRKGYGGMRFGGFNGSWKYKPKGAFLYDQEDVECSLLKMPPVDIFLAHNSPKGIHDSEDGIHRGFDGLNSYIQRCSPKLLIHGHQHMDCETMVNETKVIGVYGFKIVVI